MRFNKKFVGNVGLMVAPFSLARINPPGKGKMPFIMMCEGFL